MLGSRGSRIWDSSLAPRGAEKDSYPFYAAGSSCIVSPITRTVGNGIACSRRFLDFEAYHWRTDANSYFGSSRMRGARASHIAKRHVVRHHNG